MSTLKFNFYLVSWIWYSQKNSSRLKGNILGMVEQIAVNTHWFTTVGRRVIPSEMFHYFFPSVGHSSVKRDFTRLSYFSRATANRFHSERKGKQGRGCLAARLISLGAAFWNRSIYSRQHDIINSWNERRRGRTSLRTSTRQSPRD